MSAPSVKYLHIMTDTNFQVTGSFIRMINERAGTGEHMFLMDESNFTVPEDIRKEKSLAVVKNLGSSSEGMRILLDYCSASEHIFWHSLGWHWKLQKKLLKMPDITGKSIWISWGGDLYNFVKKGRNLPEKLYRKYTERIMLSFRRKMSAVCVIFPKDKEAVTKLLGDEKKVFVSRYTTFTKEDLERARPGKEDAPSGSAGEEKPFTILLGHAASPSLQHKEVLDRLLKYKNKNIKILLPLSYGDRTYAEEISSYAKSLFGDKVTVLREMMSPDDYTALLWTADMAVFHTERQIALGNICRLLYMCCKIYTKKGGALWEELTGNGCVLYDSTDIGKVDLEILKDKDALIEAGPCAFAADSMDPDKTFDMWQKVFKDVDGQ